MVLATYAPDFDLRINGDPMPAAVRSLVTSLQYEDGQNEADRVEMQIANPNLPWLQRHIRGLGFSTRLSGNAVSFDGVPALLARAAADELSVFAPVPAQAQSRTLARVVVTADGRTSDPTTYPLRRLLSGSYVLRFLPAAVVDGGAPAQAVVATEMAPVLLLTQKDDDGSVAIRAMRVAKLLNDVVDRVRKGEDVLFAALLEPSIGVGILQWFFARTKPGVINPILFLLVVVGNKQEIVPIPTHPSILARRFDAYFNNYW